MKNKFKNNNTARTTTTKSHMHIIGYLPLDQQIWYYSTLPSIQIATALLPKKKKNMDIDADKERKITKKKKITHCIINTKLQKHVKFCLKHFRVFLNTVSKEGNMCMYSILLGLPRRQMVKNLPVNAEDIRDTGSIPR